MVRSLLDQALLLLLIFVAAGNLDVAGISTFNGNVLVGTGITIQPHGGVSIAGIVTVGGDLNVQGDITYDEIGGRNINITGFSTFGNDLNVGLTTFFVDVSNGGVGIGTDNPNPNGYKPQFKVFVNNPVLALEDDGGGVNAFGFVRQNSNLYRLSLVIIVTIKFKFQKHQILHRVGLI